MKNQKIGLLGVFTALAMILSFVESQIPSLVPGIKLGLPNIAIIIILYLFSAKEAFIVSIIRVILTSLLFTSIPTMIYSLAGAILSLIFMIILKKSFAVITVSMIGAIFHNIGQILVAILITNTNSLIYYLPVLIISGLISGIIIGLISGNAVNKIKMIEL